MDKIKEVTHELEAMDPMEWHNIPKPIVKGVILLKTCASLQSQLLEYLEKHYSDFEGRSNTRILNLQKSISENQEKSKEAEDGFKSLLKFTELRLSDKIDDNMRKVTEDLYTLRCMSEERHTENKEHFSNCFKKIESFPTASVIQNMINSSLEKTKEKWVNEIRDSVFAPEIQNLSKRINLQHIAIDSLDQKISADQEQAKEQDSQLLSSLIETNLKIAKLEEDQTERARIFQLHFETIMNQLREIAGIRDEIEQQNKQNLNVITDYKNSQSQNLKKFENGLQNCQNSIDVMKQNLSQIASTKQAVTRPPSPPPPPPALAPATILSLEIPWEEITEKIKLAKSEIFEKMTEDKKKIQEFIHNKVKTVEIQGEKQKDISNTAIQELKDKLNWLPISLNQMEGMSPGEARLFTIEARLRSEENSRIQAFNHLSCLIDSLIEQKDESEKKLKSTDRRKTPQPASDSNRRMESDRKEGSEGGSILNQRLKFYTPVPEVAEGKDRRKNLKSWDEAGLGRIQTAVPIKTKYFKPGKTYVL